MSEILTKGMARNIYFGRSVFLILLFLALTYHTEKTLPERTNEAATSVTVVRGKLVQEQSNCVDCHALFGEGTYFAPELDDMVGRCDGEKNFDILFQAWMKTQPPNVPGHRATPRFHLGKGQVDDLAESPKWSSKINTNQ